MSKGKGYVDVSTVDAETSASIAAAVRRCAILCLGMHDVLSMLPWLAQVRATGATFLEAPVSGSKKPAEDGKLIFLAAGTAARGMQRTLPGCLQGKQGY
jgi:glyoxylate/succinic semialdehyde reductase